MKILKTVTKLKNWLSVMLRTKSHGAPFLYFQRVYFALSLISVYKLLSISYAKKKYSHIQARYDHEFTITNHLGTFSVNAKNDSLTKSLTSFEYAHQDWLKAADHKNVVLDIGANIGFYSLLSVKHYGYQKSFAFEPNPETADRLEKNIALNNLGDTITACRYGLSNHDSTQTLSAKAVHTGGSTFVKIEKRAGVDHIDVPIKSFATFLTESGLKPADISFIKIDVEGYEHSVLIGLQAYLSELTPGTCIFIEIHPHAKDGQDSHNLIQNAGFTLIKQSAQNNFLYKK